MKGFQPLFDYVVIRPDKAAEKTEGGILLPATVQASHIPSRGTILAVGPGKDDADGNTIEVRVEPDDIVIYEDHAARAIEIDGEKLIILRETDILGVVTD